MLHQRYTFCSQTCLLKESMVVQWWIIYTASPLTASCNHPYQYLSLYSIIMILPDVFMDVLSLAGTMAAPQSDGESLHWFRMVWSHLPQYQKMVCCRCFLFPICAFWDVIDHLSDLIYYGEHYSTWWVVGHGHPDVFVYFIPRGVYFQNLCVF